MPRHAFAGLVIALLLASCATALPSATPLGEGPLVKAEAAARAREAKAAPKKTASAGSARAPAPADAPAPAPAPSPAGPTPAPAPTAEAPKPDGKEAGKPAAPAPGKKPVIDYAGEYVGFDESTYKIEGNEHSQKDDKARTRVELGKDGQLAITFVDSSTGKDICTLKATPNGKTATLAAGQKCWEEGGAMSGTLTRGTATFDGKKLTIDADFDLLMGPPDRRMSGQLHYRFEGSKK